MQRKMRYRLGLDIGSTSIGGCMIRLDQDGEPCAIIRMGVRIFPDGRNPKDGSSLAVTRRQARQMRRRRDRLLKRKLRLLNALVDLQFFPADEGARRQLVLLDPYELRGSCGFTFGNSCSGGTSDATLFFGAPSRKKPKTPMEVS